MKNIQRLYDAQSLTNDIYKYQSTEYHRKNIIDIKKRKKVKLYSINEDYLEMKKRNQSPSKRISCN